MSKIVKDITEVIKKRPRRSQHSFYMEDALHAEFVKLCNEKLKVPASRTVEELIRRFLADAKKTRR